jgi:antitoxin VapB
MKRPLNPRRLPWLDSLEAGDTVRSMTTAKLFRNGRSQAVRLPKEFRFEGNEVEVCRVGRGVLLLPEEKGPWARIRAVAEGGGKYPAEIPAPLEQERPLDWTRGDAPRP